MKKILFAVFPFFLLSSSFSQVRLDSGLVAYYPFNGNANDASGNGNNVVFNNASLTSDYLGNANSAYHFNGIDNYMMVPNSSSLNMTNQMSIAVKVRPLGFYTGPCYNNMMLMKGDADYVTGTYFLRYSDIITGCTNYATTADEQFYGSGVVATNPIIQLNQWYSVIWTYNGTTAKIYIDCNLMGSADSAFNPFTSNFDLYIGKMNNAQYPYWLNGDLDDIRIYNRPLTEDEIYALCVTEVSLPVILTKFEVTANGNQIKLNWNLENEEGIVKYTVERSATGHSDFVSLQSIVAKKSHTYSFADNTVEANQNYYYRLAILTNNGVINYSAIRTAKIINNNSYIVVYPNPSKGNISVKINGYIGEAKFTIINSLGQVVFQQSHLIADNSPVPLNTGNIFKGIYWLRVQTINSEFTSRIVFF
jgi:hypothetical protein